MTAPAPPAIAAAVAWAMLGEFDPNSCIAAARVSIEVCGYFGIAAQPQPVTVAAFTPMAWELRDMLVSKPADEWPPGAWSVGVSGGEHKPGRWNGHLVTLTGTGPGDPPCSWLLDPSLGQLSRPTRGLRVGPAAFALADGLPDDPKTDTAFIDPSGLVIVYGKLRDDKWRDSPNWNKRRGYILRTAGAAIRSLRGL